MHPWWLMREAGSWRRQEIELAREAGDNSDIESLL
jgi:hypothetical protein